MLSSLFTGKGFQGYSIVGSAGNKQHNRNCGSYSSAVLPPSAWASRAPVDLLMGVEEKARQSYFLPSHGTKAEVGLPALLIS